MSYPALLFAATCLLSSANAQTIWYVDSSATAPGNGSASQPYAELQYALAAGTTQNGDTLVVAPGTYVGGFDFLGKNVAVRSTQGPQSTILDGNLQDVSVVRFENNEGPGAVLEGFTVTRGQGTLSSFYPVSPGAREGGGIRCIGASPLLKNLVIENNRATRGGGVLLLDSAATLSYCTIAENQGDGPYVQGMGIFSNDPNAVIEHCTIENQTNYAAQIAGGGFCGRATVRDTLFRNNRGAAGAAAMSFGTTFERCSFLSNSHLADTSQAIGDGGAISHLSWYPGPPLVDMTGFVEGPTLASDCLFANNVAGRGGAVACAPGHSFEVRDSYFAGNMARNYAPASSTPGLGGAAFHTTLVNCEVTSNHAGHGGGLYRGEATHCRIYGNQVAATTPVDSAAVGGGAWGSNLVDCDVFDNVALPDPNATGPTPGGKGGGTYGGTALRTRYYRNTADFGGGAAGGSLEHCTLFENYAASQGGSLFAA